MTTADPPNVGNTTVGTSPVLIAPRVTERRGLLVTNCGTVTCYLGPENTVTPTTGYPLLAGASVTTTVRFSIYAVCASTSTVVGYIDDSGA